MVPVGGIVVAHPPNVSTAIPWGTSYLFMHAKLRFRPSTAEPAENDGICEPTLVQPNPP